MKEIEKGIHEIHAQAREKKENERQNDEDKTVEGLYQRAIESSNKTIYCIILSLSLLPLLSFV